MNIDFSAIDRAVEKVIAKHDAMFKLEMNTAQLKRDGHEYPFSFILGISQAAAIIGEFKAKINAINGSKTPEGASVYSIDRNSDNKGCADMLRECAAGNGVVICIPD